MPAEPEPERLDPGPGIGWDATRAIFDGMRDYICIHRAVLGDNGKVTDCELVNWNKAYERVRTKEVVTGQLMSETYFEPQSALMYVNEAWETGRAHQFFELNATTKDKYRPDGAVVRIEVEWQRTGPYIVEIGSDLSEFQVMQLRLAAQESESVALETAASLAADRERIARDLHDTVIQQLFALSLTTQSMAEKEPDIETQTRLNGVSSTLTSLISEIRREIFDVRSMETDTVAGELEKVVSVSRLSGDTRISVESSVASLPPVHMVNLRAVVREAVSNALRHGGATEVSVKVDETDGIATLTVSDNGRGVPDGTMRSSGLSNMRRRAELLGGTFTLSPRDGGGTEVMWRVPS